MMEKKNNKSRKVAVILVILIAVSALTYFSLINLGLLPDNPLTEKFQPERIEFTNFVPPADEPVNFDDFLGSESCASCHREVYDQWKGSTHGQAGGDPDQVSIIGDFDGIKREFSDAAVTPYVNERGEYMFRLETEGMPDKTFRVDAVVGGGHMIGGGTQTYFTEMPDGTVRFLPFDFHRDSDSWFGESNDGRGWIPISDARPIDKVSEWHPRRVLGMDITMNNCQECHGSQIQLNYDTEEKKYQTRYVSLSINCESCHGPGSDHVKLMNMPGKDTIKDIGMTALATLSKDASLNVCFRCHALKDVLEPGYLPGKDLEDHYALKFPVFSTDPFHNDFRIREFGYQQNHLASDCYISGSMTCVDCHDPHSQDYRDINWVKLEDPFDDGQCTSCHPSKGIRPSLHTFHEPDSPGSKCVSCHMPYLDHKATGNQLRFARSDHTIPIPRPEYDDALGIENACLQCHEDLSVRELQAQVEAWYGELKPHNPSVAAMDAYHQGMGMLEAAELLLEDSTNHKMAQMAGLSQFTRDFIRPDMEDLDPEIINRIKNYITDLDIDLKSLAFASLHVAGDRDPAIHNFLAEELADLEDDEEAKVRARWAHTMPFLAAEFEKKGDMGSAIKINRKALEVQPENTAILMNLGRTYESAGNYDSAIAVYSRVVRLEENNGYAWLSIGNALQAKGDQNRAIRFFEKSIEVNPWIFQSHLYAGNYYYASGQVQKAIGAYQRAVQVNPAEATGHLYLAMAYLKENKREEALVQARIGNRLAPRDPAGRQLLQLLEGEGDTP